MSASGQVSITSSVGTSLVFTVTGTNTLGYAKTFERILLNAGTVTEKLINHDGSITTGTENNDGNYALTLNEVETSGQFTLPTADPHAITFIDEAGAATVNGSGVNDYVLVTGDSTQATYSDQGGNNTVILANGNNTYEGHLQSGHDVIVAGSGHNTIMTGTGSDTIYSGPGDATIFLNDTAAGAFSGSFNDFVYLNDGENTVVASGAADAIVAMAPGQVIYGSDDTVGATIVTILPGGAEGAGDTIYGGAASIAVFDSVGGNTFNTGAGQAYFVAGATMSDIFSDTVNASGGSVYMFGSEGDSVTFAGTVGDGKISGFVAGSGNETLNAAGFSGGNGALAMFASNVSDSVAAQNVNDSLVGGNGLNAFLTGEGNETLDGGTSNLFYIEHTADDTNANTGKITVQDFANSNWGVAFVGYTQDELTARKRTRPSTAVPILPTRSSSATARPCSSSASRHSPATAVKGGGSRSFALRKRAIQERPTFGLASFLNRDRARPLRPLTVLQEHRGPRRRSSCRLRK